MLAYIRDQFIASVRAGDLLAALDWMDAFDEEVARIGLLVAFGGVQASTNG